MTTVLVAYMVYRERRHVSLRAARRRALPVPRKYRGESTRSSIPFGSVQFQDASERRARAPENLSLFLDIGGNSFRTPFRPREETLSTSLLYTLRVTLIISKLGDSDERRAEKKKTVKNCMHISKIAAYAFYSFENYFHFSKTSL